MRCSSAAQLLQLYIDRRLKVQKMRELETICLSAMRVNMSFTFWKR